MDNIQNITLDIMNNKIYDYIYTKQYDVGRVIKFQITQDHNRMSLDNTSIVFQLSKPDGYVIIESLPIMNNVATLTLTEQCTAVAGKLPYQLSVYDQDSKIFSTVTGYMICDKAVIEDGTVRSTSGGNLVGDLMNFYENNLLDPVEVTLRANAWENNTQTVSCPGASEDEAHQLIVIRPSNSSMEPYLEAEVLCVEQGEGTLTFACTNVPEIDLTVYALFEGINSRLGNISWMYSRTMPNEDAQFEHDMWITEYGSETMNVIGDDPFTPSSVQVEPIVTEGVNIADITVDGTTYSLYSPDDVETTYTDHVGSAKTKIGELTVGEVASSIYMPTISVTPLQQTGTNIADISIGERVVHLYAPSGGGGGSDLAPVRLTQDEYDALTYAQKTDPTKLYFVSDDEEVEP